MVQAIAAAVDHDSLLATDIGLGFFFAGLTMKIAMTGGTGFGAKHLSRELLRQGPCHVCASNPVTNRAFTRALGEAINRPTSFRVPAIFLTTVFGEGAKAMTPGQYVVSDRLPQTDFRFKFPELPAAIDEIIGPTGAVARFPEMPK